MRTVLKRTAAIAASMALVASSTAAVAAAPAPAPAAYQAPSAWMMLSVLSPTGASVLGSAAAAQPADVPPPPGPPPPPPYVAGGAMSGGAGELIPFALWFGLIAVALTITDKQGLDQATGSPNSAT